MKSTSIRIAGALGVVLLGATPGLAQGPGTTPAPHATTVFRGDAARTGAYADAGPARGATVEWSAETGGTVRSTPAVTREAVFAGSGDGHLYAFDPADGSVRWRYEAGEAVIGSPAVSEDRVVVTTRDGSVHAVARRTGRGLWTVPGTPGRGLTGGWDYYASSPLIVGDRVVTGAPDGTVRALELATGRVIWTHQTGAPVRSSPAAADGTVVVGDDAGRIHALRLDDGTPVWTHETMGVDFTFEEWGFDRSTIQATPAIAGGRVFVGSRDGGLYALDFATGERLWRVDYGFPWVVTSAAVADGRVYVGSSDGQFVQAVDAVSGEEVWRTDVGARVFASPAHTPDALFIADHDGFIRALDPATGAVRWSLRLARQIQSSPVPHGGSLFVGADDGALYRLDAAPAPPHLAVFWDSAMSELAVRPGGRLLRDYLADAGYEVLDSGQLAEWLRARTRDADTAGDPARSVVVFALDQVPESVSPGADSVGALRRYLDAGGKVVWTGFPPWSLVRDSTGRPVRIDHDVHRRALGIDLSPGETGDYGARPTEAGREWGLSRTRLSTAGIAAAPDVTALAEDELGRAAAAVRSYGGRPGTGFVVLWGQGATWPVLAEIRAAAEYGIVR